MKSIVQKIVQISVINSHLDVFSVSLDNNIMTKRKIIVTLYHEKTNAI